MLLSDLVDSVVRHISVPGAPMPCFIISLMPHTSLQAGFGLEEEQVHAWLQEHFQERRVSVQDGDSVFLIILEPHERLGSHARSLACRPAVCDHGPQSRPL